MPPKQHVSHPEPSRRLRSQNPAQPQAAPVPDTAPAAGRRDPAASPALTPGHIQLLQRTAGNRTVVVMLQHARPARPAQPAAARSDGALAALAQEFGRRIEGQLAIFATAAGKNEAQAANTPAASSKAGGPKTKAPPPFPLILKYIVKLLLDNQIDGPTTRPRKLQQAYADPLGDPGKGTLFPTLYEQEFVDQLKGLSETEREELKRRVAELTVTYAAPYTEKQMHTTTDAIRAEYAALGEKLRSNIEGGIEGYYACRTGILGAFSGGSANVQATLATASAYYESLPEANFLQGGTSKKPEGHKHSSTPICGRRSSRQRK